MLITCWYLGSSSNIPIDIDIYRDAFMFQVYNFPNGLNMECHIGEFYPSLLRLTLDEGSKHC